MFVCVCTCVSVCILTEKKPSSIFADHPDHKTSAKTIVRIRVPAETEPPEKTIASAPVAIIFLFSMCTLLPLLVLSTPEVMCQGSFQSLFTVSLIL